ncbi:MAG: NifB/NifX family molybdenum-iron cluster-binding protein [Anaerolineales bacterium]
MKIAAITEDGKTISQHFGRAPYYLVATIEDGKIVNREMREKLGHTQFQEEEGHHHHQSGGDGHGFGHSAEKRHHRMSEAIKDCQAVLGRGMGRGAYENLIARGIRPVITDIPQIEDAVLAYVSGTIEDHVEKLH